MTEYVLEFYSKGARKPYDTETGWLPNGFHPTYCNTKECFEFRCSGIHIGSGKVKIRYKSNGGLAAITYTDRYGNSRLRWLR